MENVKYFYPIKNLSDFIYHFKYNTLNIQGFDFTFDEIRNNNIKKLNINFIKNSDNNIKEIIESQYKTSIIQYNLGKFCYDRDFILKSKFPKIEEINIGNIYEGKNFYKVIF